jgi:hypothetical protein
MAASRIHDHHDDDDTVEAHYSGLERLEAPHGTPHGCYDGHVFIGHMVEDSEAGEEAEIVEAVPCRRCNAGEAR